MSSDKCRYFPLSVGKQVMWYRYTQLIGFVKAIIIDYHNLIWGIC